MTILFISIQFFEDPVSSTVDAAIRLQPRCSEVTERGHGEPLYITRLLVPTSQIGCLIGKGGSVITSMRRATQANIRIMSNENHSKVVSEDDVLVQVTYCSLFVCFYIFSSVCRHTDLYSCNISWLYSL